MNSEIDFILDEIRRECELGNIKNVIILSKKLESLTNQEIIMDPKIKESIEKKIEFLCSECESDLRVENGLVKIYMPSSNGRTEGRRSGMVCSKDCYEKQNDSNFKEKR